MLDGPLGGLKACLIDAKPRRYHLKVVAEAKISAITASFFENLRLKPMARSFDLRHEMLWKAWFGN